MHEWAIQLKAEVLKALGQPTRPKILECIRIRTRKEGVRVMVKVKDPATFDILDCVSAVLRKRLEEKEQIFSRI